MRNLTSDEFLGYLNATRACRESREWVEDKKSECPLFIDLWRTCHCGHWMHWLVIQVHGYESREAGKAAGIFDATVFFMPGDSNEFRDQRDARCASLTRSGIGKFQMESKIAKFMGIDLAD